MSRENETIPDHYTPECPLCKGVLLPERVEYLEAENEKLRIQSAENSKLRDQLELAQSAADQWRDLYMARK